MLEEIRDKKLAIANWIMEKTITGTGQHLSKEQCTQLELAMRCLTSAEETTIKIEGRSLPRVEQFRKGLAAYELS